eukprot:Gb_38678 [translate_table: standard]
MVTMCPEALTILEVTSYEVKRLPIDEPEITRGPKSHLHLDTIEDNTLASPSSIVVPSIALSLNSIVKYSKGNHLPGSILASPLIDTGSDPKKGQWVNLQIKPTFSCSKAFPRDPLLIEDNELPRVGRYVTSQDRTLCMTLEGQMNPVIEGPKGRNELQRQGPTKKRVCCIVSFDLGQDVFNKESAIFRLAYIKIVFTILRCNDPRFGFGCYLTRLSPGDGLWLADDLKRTWIHACNSVDQVRRSALQFVMELQVETLGRVCASHARGHSSSLGRKKKKCVGDTAETLGCRIERLQTPVVTKMHFELWRFAKQSTTVTPIEGRGYATDTLKEKQKFVLSGDIKLWAHSSRQKKICATKRRFKVEATKSSKEIKPKIEENQIGAGRPPLGVTQKLGASTPPTPAELKTQDQFDDVDQEALTMICMSMSDDCLSHVKDATTSKKAWDSLKSIYETMNESRVLYLRNELFGMRMFERDLITSHIARIKNLKEQLIVVGESIRPKELVHITLNNLPRSYKMFATDLTTTSRVSTITFEELSGKWKGKSKQPKFQSSIFTKLAAEESRTNPTSK